MSTNVVNNFHPGIFLMKDSEGIKEIQKYIKIAK